MKVREEFITEVLGILNSFRGVKTGQKNSFVLVSLGEGQFMIGRAMGKGEEPEEESGIGDLKFIHECLNELVEGLMGYYETREARQKLRSQINSR